MLSRAGFPVWRGRRLYSKPHLEHADQLARLIERGLTCDDEAAGIALLRSIGYYRLSAYIYPYRKMLPEAEQGKVTPVHFRADTLVEGVSLEHIAAMVKFDRKLRALIGEAMEIVEVGLRSHVAHVGGRRNPFFHLDVHHLDRKACLKTRNTGDRPAFDRWQDRYVELQDNASREDYVKHHLAKYGEPFPIWIAVEFLDFGAVARLLELMDRQDQNEVARALGVKGGTLAAAWIKALNNTRNLAAHHKRVWNRTLTYQLRQPRPEQLNGDLRDALDGARYDKMYAPLAVMASLIRHIDPGNRWPVHLKEHVQKFPDVPHLTPENDMGFPEGWKTRALWRP